MSSPLGLLPNPPPTPPTADARGVEVEVAVKFDRKLNLLVKVVIELVLESVGGGRLALNVAILSFSSTSGMATCILRGPREPRILAA